MKEIGGYLELDTYNLPMLHENAIGLNSARNCLAYIIQKRKIKKIYVPKFLCDSVAEICKREGTEVVYYSINIDFMPCLADTDEWVYLVNYYGQLSNKKIELLRKKYSQIIVDNVQAYFQEPIIGVDTIYTCRKYFGVPDGAFLYSDVEVDNLDIDESYDRFNHILGRFERSASEYYSEYANNEKKISKWPVKRMSKLTNNLLHGVDYSMVKSVRNQNYKVLSEQFNKINKLSLEVPDGPYMYPLFLESGDLIRKSLQKENIYISTLWPDVFSLCSKHDLEYTLAQNILPMPVDQRYSADDMIALSNITKNMIEKVN